MIYCSRVIIKLILYSEKRVQVKVELLLGRVIQNNLNSRNPKTPDKLTPTAMQHFPMIVKYKFPHFFPDSP
jgi:hypothetical protein